MLTPPTRANPSRRQAAVSASVGAPVGGWNARDALDGMKPTDAIQLDNFIPGAGNVRLRNGSYPYAFHVGQLSTFTRASAAYYFDSDGVLQSAAIDTPRYSYINGAGLFGAATSLAIVLEEVPTLVIESAATNECLHGRDLTNAAWTKTNVTAAKNQAGIDGAANSASSITATAANGTALQSVTSASNTGRAFSAYAKWVSGSGGSLSYTIDGSTYTTTPFTQGVWRKLQVTGTLANPTVGFKIPTSGDVFAIDFCQEETGSTASSPILTTGTSATRAADSPSYNTGATATTVDIPTETLVSYASNATKKLLACAAGRIYDVTAGGPISLPLSSGYTSDRWQYVNFKGYALLFNGADSPIKYDGSSVSSNSVTGSGLTSSNLTYPWVFKERVFVIENGTMNAWYLGSAAISGSATKLDFSSVCQLGGKLIAGGTWTRDGGSGSDDYCVFVTSRGEVLVYQGTDPASADTWALVGRFHVGPPIGQRPLLAIGSDLVLISIDGYLPLSRVLPIDRAGAQGVALSDKIRNAVNEATRAYGGNFGWEAVHYPKGNWGIVNVPVTEGEEQHQHVINTVTGSWCRFTGMNANCWSVYSDDLYFGGNDGTVYLADTGIGDTTIAGDEYDTANTVGEIFPAFNYFGRRGQLKRFTMARPVISTDGVVAFAHIMNTDFSDLSPTNFIVTSNTSGSAWDEAEWDEAAWAGDTVIQKGWLSSRGLGYCGSLRLRVDTNAIQVSVNSIDYVFEPGGVL